MPKRYKKGNRKKKKTKQDDIFFKRETELNSLIKHFVNDYYQLSYPPLESEYDNMNNQRLKIKRLLDVQGKVIWNKSRKRRRIYYEQLSRFKYFYVAWKHFTYYIYLERRFHIPRHHCTSLSFFKHNNQDINSIRYQL